MRLPEGLSGERSAVSTHITVAVGDPGDRSSMPNVAAELFRSWLSKHVYARSQYWVSLPSLKRTVIVRPDGQENPLVVGNRALTSAVTA